MIQSVLELSEIRVRNIMTPRVDIVSINLHASLEDVKIIFLTEKYSRIPVYNESKDDIVGILYQHDVFVFLIESPNAKAIPISDLMQSPIFIPDTMKVSDLLTRLQKEKQHMVIIADEYGGTAGLVTMEDALEEVVGEIYDEHDEVEQLLIQQSQTLFKINADISLSQLFHDIEVDLEVPGEYSSLGNWLYLEAEDIPQIGMSYTYHHLNFTISEVENRRIKSVILKILNSGDENQFISEC